MSSSNVQSHRGHSIAVASRLTGIPVETLRVWERRYGFPSPARVSGTNRRSFRDAEIDRLRWIARALKRGFRAGDVVPKKVAEIEAMLAATERLDAAAAIPSARPVALATVEHAIALLGQDDVFGLESELRRLAGMVGPRRFVTDVAHPIAVALGDAWERGELEVRHEHLASECLTTQLRAMLGGYQDLAGAPTVLLATLPGEPHALGLGMVALYLATAGARPRLLGPSTPPEQISIASEMLRVDVVGLTITAGCDAAEARRHLRRLIAHLPRGVDLWVGGAGAERASSRLSRAHVVSSWQGLDDAVIERRARAR